MYTIYNLHITRYRIIKCRYLHITVSLALARMAELNLAGPTWHWYSASSSKDAFEIFKLYTPWPRSPKTEYRGKPGITAEKPVKKKKLYC